VPFDKITYILFEKYIHILSLEMVRPGNQHRADCIGTLSFPTAHSLQQWSSSTSSQCSTSAAKTPQTQQYHLSMLNQRCQDTTDPAVPPLNAQPALPRHHRPDLLNIL